MKSSDWKLHQLNRIQHIIRYLANPEISQLTIQEEITQLIHHILSRTSLLKEAITLLLSHYLDKPLANVLRNYQIYFSPQSTWYRELII